MTGLTPTAKQSLGRQILQRVTFLSVVAIVGSLVAAGLALVVALQTVVLQLKESSSTVALTFENFLGDIKSDLVATSSALDVHQNSQVVLRQLLARHAPIFEAILVQPDGTVVAQRRRVGVQNQAKMGEQPWLEQTQAKEIYLSPIDSVEFGVPFIYIAVPVVDERNKLRASLVAKIDLTALWNKAIEFPVGETGYVYITDKSGHLLGYRDLRLLQDGVMLEDIIGYSPQEIVVSNLLVYQGLNGSWVMGSGIELESSPWVILVEQPLTDLVRPLVIQGLIFTTTLLIITGLAYSIIAFIQHSVVAPLLVLQEGVNLLSEGNWGQSIEVKADNELGLLAGAFNHMAKQLQTLINTLEERVAERTQEVEQRTEELRQSERKYRGIFEDSRDLILITHSDGKVVDTNAACLPLLGYTPEEMLKANLFEQYIDFVDRLRFQADIELHGAVKDFAVKLQRKDGVQRDCLMTGTIRYDYNGLILGYQVVIRDVTEQKRAEQERLKLTAMQRDLSLAQEIQYSLLLSPQPNWLGVELVCFTTPAKEVGGDFYAYYHGQHEKPDLPNLAYYRIALGDVSGKGVPAALLMATSLMWTQAAMRQEMSPDDLLQYLDESLLPYTKPKQQNCAMVYVEIEQLHEVCSSRAKYTLRAANAGCIPPYIKRVTGEVLNPEIGGFALGQGLGKITGYQLLELTLYQGDLFVLVSDGVIEAHNAQGKILGFDGMLNLMEAAPVTSAEGLLSYLKQKIIAFTEGVEQHDDITIIVGRV